MSLKEAVARLRKGIDDTPSGIKRMGVFKRDLIDLLYDWHLMNDILRNQHSEKVSRETTKTEKE